MLQIDEVLRLNQLLDYVFLDLMFLRIYEGNKVLLHQPSFSQIEIEKNKNQTNKNTNAFFRVFKQITFGHICKFSYFFLGQKLTEIIHLNMKFLHQIFNLFEINSKKKYFVKKNRIFTAASVVCLLFNVHLLA